jgi:hypothetical protein
MDGAPAFTRRAVRGMLRYLPSASPSSSPVSGHAVRMARAARGAAPPVLVLDRRLRMG